tara:strand:+ start:236 stop:649 length:414 start_codon:yes stop_codon:yes gene_type:complete
MSASMGAKVAAAFTKELLRYTKSVAKLKKEKKPGYKEEVKKREKEFQAFKRGFKNADDFLKRKAVVKLMKDFGIDTKSKGDAGAFFNLEERYFKELMKRQDDAIRRSKKSKDNDDPIPFYKGGVVDIVDAGKYFKHK